ncbi:winged helix-turn-helix transcriptional regulator [Phyllobacterium sp. 22229]|uniref:DNA-binding response regulator n=1 Tax=Phyllobacterium myrsinacearum TaxID=28101 RepID=A0A2S9J9X5_9HYPH|nr:response regulator transcription factor [Phyllobacterium myrsinacearum]PRD49497.1 DNA-binding response regulator [Phyllobacterium myrsinacearum]PWV83501.1 two-component system phosphate regulon response regulator PhoB [Phyllobacterium myrsinacearum]RZS70596.1 two-component system phosphate regulon response regulator PhoB [Phyllobacterium myrsinacearum]RZU96763.1 two-component system phosphate regulon response regulator PhoB [Phyllobacterium myrsinacearum]
MAPVIVICSHDAEFFLMLQHIFEAEGFRSEIAQTVDEAVRLEEAGNVAAIILDCEQDFKFAAEICAKFRSGQTGGKVPIIARVVSGCDKSYIGLLKAGVDQVFARPVAPQWFLSSLRTIVGPGRDCNRPGESKSRLSVGGLTILPDKFRVHRHDGKSIHLSPIEFKILCVVAQFPGKIFSREELVRAAWPENVHVEPRTVDVHIGRLRRLLKRETGMNLIRTIRSIGYAFVNDEASRAQS